jgi:hypothetical protein
MYNPGRWSREILEEVKPLALECIRRKAAQDNRFLTSQQDVDAMATVLREGTRVHHALRLAVQHRDEP